MALGIHSLGEAAAGVLRDRRPASASASPSAGSRPRRASCAAGRSRSRGEQRLADGTTRELTAASLAAPLDGSLAALSAALVLLAAALVAIRL